MKIEFHSELAVERRISPPQQACRTYGGSKVAAPVSVAGSVCPRVAVCWKDGDSKKSYLLTCNLKFPNSDL